MHEKMPTARLAELANFTMGQSPDSAHVNDDERGLPFLQGCAEFGDRHPSARVYCSPPLRIAKAGSTLISVRAPVGTMNRADQDYCIGRGLAAILAKGGVADDVFLTHAIEHNISYLHRRSQGSTFLAVGSADLKTMPVAAPDLPQQQRIAEVLSTVDEAIEQTKALIAKTPDSDQHATRLRSSTKNPRWAGFRRSGMSQTCLK
jgi:type I restriction enzyme S subunit